MKSTTMFLVMAYHVSLILLSTHIGMSECKPIKSTSPPTAAGDGYTNQIAYLQTKNSSKNYQQHNHEIKISSLGALGIQNLENAFCDDPKGKFPEVETEEKFYHFHRVELCRIRGSTHQYRMRKCDGETHCWDGHPQTLKTFFKAKPKSNSTTSN